MIKLPVKVRFEQAVYGSFPFWHRGYAVLAHSEGCRPEWLAELRTVCQRCGEPPAGLIPADSLFALRLKCGPWMIVGAYPQGRDDQDRPGAWRFTRFSSADMLTNGSAPIHLPSTGPCAAIGAPSTENEPFPWSSGPPVELKHRPHALAPGTMTRGWSRSCQLWLMGVGSSCNRTSRSVVWREVSGAALPRSVRRRATVATWAFDNANHFDLVGLPKLAGVALNASDLILALEPASR